MELTTSESAYIIDTICKDIEVFYKVIELTNTLLSDETKLAAVKQFASKAKLPAEFLEVNCVNKLYEILNILFESEINKITIENIGKTMRHNYTLVNKHMVERLYELPNYSDKHLLIYLECCITICGINLYDKIAKLNDKEIVDIVNLNPRTTIKEALFAFIVESTIAYSAP